MELLVLALLSLVVVASGGSDAELLEYEPVQYLKGHVSVQANPVWNKLLESSPQEAKETVLVMKDNLNQQLHKSGVSVVFAKGDRVLVKRLTGGAKWEKSIQVPFAGVISLIGATLPILLENYKRNVIADPIVEVLRGNDRNNALVKGYEQKSLLDLLNTLPSGTATALSEVDQFGRVAHYVVGTVLEHFAKEAWMDALLSVGMDDSTVDATLKTSIGNLIQYILMLSHDFETLGPVPKKDLTDLDSGHYLFGWWINCGTTANTCLIPEAPPGTIFSITRTIRMYLSPSLDLSLLVVASNSKAKTVADALQEDRLIWQQLYSAIDEEAAHSQAKSDVSDQNDKPHDNKKSEKSGQESDSEGSEMLIKFIHWAWPVSVFLVWITSSHVWVYWMLLCIWHVATTIFPQAHRPRPKTAKAN